MNWTPICQGLPSHFIEVVTLFNNSVDPGFPEVCLNYVTKKTVIEADGSKIAVPQWNKNNDCVTHWLADMPEVPNI